MRKQASLLITSLLLSGSVSVWAAPAPVSEVGKRGSASDLEQRVATLEAMLQSRNLVQVQLQQQIEYLQQEVAQLRGQVEEQGYTQQQIVDRQRDIYQEIDKRMSQQPATPAVTAETPPATQEPAPVSLGEAEAYDKAVNLIVKERRYDDAIPEFERFVKAHPNSSYVPNAYYWLGQLLLGKSDFSRAKNYFAKVVNDFPDANKRADAMLGLGNVEQKLGNAKQAAKYFQQVIKEYPSSQAAKLAKERL